MNIQELDSYNLADTIKFHDRLNPRLWDSEEHLRPEVKAKLMKVAQDFQEFLGVPDLDVKDITISGSNAAFNYTPASDIDLHIVIDIPDVDHDEVYRELFNAKKYQYNDEHDIRIRGADVELYAQDSKQPHHSQGIYSLLRNSWLSVPKRHRAEIDDVSARSKFEDLAARIDDTIKTHNVGRMDSLMKKIKTMRQTGLEQQGEFGSDNIAFKLLRNNGYIKRLWDAKQKARDLELSLAELAQPRQKIRYGFGESPDGVDPTTKMFLEEPMDESPDGVNPTTAMFLTENDIDIVLSRFFDNCIDFLDIQNAPEMVLHHNTDWSEKTGSFGQYDPDNNLLHLATSGRHVLDILRTMAHELTHCKQNELQTLPDNAGETGSRWEDEANAMAGRIMRHWADEHPEMFKDVSLEESASGYIPTKAQAKDPRYSMALTVDIKPGQVGKEANKLNLKTDRQGRPALLMKSVNLQESLAQEFEKFSKSKGREEPWDRDGYEPPGPEFPPQMPAGTTKIDVTDLTDWYRLGQDISDMDDAEPEDYNQGPPQTVITFASDELEQQYLKQFKRLGLKTHDMDPDVKGGEDTTGKHLQQKLAEEFAVFESQDLFEINMGSKNLRKEAAKTGAIAGMEFEMIVPNVEGDSGDLDQEADYDYDQRCRSIQDAYDFFYDGDWNSRRSCDEMRDSMRNDYTEWLDEKIATDWERGGDDYITDWVKNNVDESEWNPDDLSGDARNEALEEYSANIHADPVSDQYQTAYEEFREENQESYDESDWLDDADLSNMSEIENAYSMSWPHWSDPQSGGESSIEDVAQEFENAIGRDVRASGNYHSGSVLRPSPTQIRYVVEPDGSLEPDDPNDQGLEFVSPPLPIDEILSDLNKVKAWAKEYGCYTNDSTGLHINISVPDYSRERLDFVKLALLMGDRYVLDAFGRTGNTYAKSAMGIIKDAVRNKPEDAAQLLNKMKGNMDQLASKAIHSGITSKYTSINTKDGHIEFRSPGGDWLGDNFDQIENTLLRFTVAMSAALNPDAYRQEYLTKLYKMLTENNRGDDTIRYFADYVAGKIPKAALRSFVKLAQLQRNVRRGKIDQKMWWKVYKDGQDSGRYGSTVEVVASSKKEAIDKAAAEWGLFSQEYKNRMDAEVVRPYDELSDKSDAPQTGTGTYELFDRRTGEAVPDTEFSARNQADVNTRLDDYINFGPHGIGTVDARLVFGARPVADSGGAGQGASSNSLRPTGFGPWEVYNRQTGASTVNLVQGGQPITDRDQAQQLAMNLIAAGRHDLYGVRTRSTEGRPNIGTQSEMEARLGMINQSADNNRSGWTKYEIVDRQNLDPVFRFWAADRDLANRIYGEWLAAAGLPQTTEDYGFQEIRPQPSEISRDWRIVNSSNGETLNTVRGASRDQAEAVQLDTARRNGINFSQLILQSVPADDIPEVPLDIEQNLPDRTDGRNIDYSFRDLFGTTDQASSAPAGNSFSGQWRVMLDGEEVWRFRGPANGGQADANRIAQLWLRDQRSQGLLSPAPGADVEVVPVMMESVRQHVNPAVAEGSLNEYKNTALEEFNGLEFRFVKDDPYIRVGAFAPKTQRQIAQVDFKILDNNGLEPQDLHVEERFRGQGIAKIMYDFVKNKGYKIHRSWSQTDAGAAFWDKHRGQERVWEQGMAEGVYRGDWVRHPDNPWQIGQIQSIDNGQAAVTWKKTDKRKKAMSSTHAVDALQHARREFSQLTQPTHTPGMAEGFLGEYPSIETTLGEATHPDLVKYDKKFQKQLHRDLDVGQGKGKKIDIDYNSDEKGWSDITHVQDYTGGSLDTNDYLHRQYRNKAKAKELTTHQAKIQALDRILANHKLPQQIVVYTGLRQSPAEAWETYGADVTKPIRLHLPAYTSTTTKLKVALIHAGEGEIAQVSRARHQPRNKDAPEDEWGTQILMMTLPAGLPAASVKKISEFPEENEILLPRGIDIEINPSPTVLKDGDYVWHATVLSHSPVQIASPMQENFTDVDESLTEIAAMPAHQFAGGKDMLGMFQTPTKKHLKPLPGGTDLQYAIETNRYGSIVQIVDPGMPGITRPEVVAVLNLDSSNLPNTVQVGSITVDEDYRGRGLAKSLYGIVLTIMRKNLVSGSGQTPGGRRNWMILASIPGVEVQGLVRIPNQIFDMARTATVSPQWRKYAERTVDQIMELGGQFHSKDNNSTYWLFDVVPGKGSLQPAVKNALSRLYGYDSDNLLLATWTGA